MVALALILLLMSAAIIARVLSVTRQQTPIFIGLSVWVAVYTYTEVFGKVDYSAGSLLMYGAGSSNAQETKAEQWRNCHQYTN